MPALARTLDITREQWLELRRRGIGSSDAAAVCGLDPYMSPLEVWMDKTGRKPPKEPSERQQRRMQAGLRMEETIRDMFAERTGLKPRRRREILRHPEHTFMLCNLDYILPGGIPVELKNTEDRKGEWTGGEAPERYLIQVHHQIVVTGAPHAYLVALINGWDLRIIKVPRDEEIARMLVAREKEFWGYVERDEQPPVDGGEATTKALAALYKAKPGLAVNLSENFASVAAMYLDAEEREERAKADKTRAANQVKALMGEAVLAVIPSPEGGGYKVTWPEINPRPAFDEERFAKERPDLYAQYVKPRASYRRFALSPIKVREE